MLEPHLCSPPPNPVLSLPIVLLFLGFLVFQPHFTGQLSEVLIYDQVKLRPGQALGAAQHPESITYEASDLTSVLYNFHR